MGAYTHTLRYSKNIFYVFTIAQRMCVCTHKNTLQLTRVPKASQCAVQRSAAATSWN